MADSDRIVALGRFCAVGAGGALAYVVLLVLLIEAGGIDATAASSIAFAIVVAQNYLLHHAWTFGGRAPHARAAPQFVAVSASGWALNAALMYGGVEWLGLHWVPVQAFALAAVLGWNFLCSERLVFRSGP